MQLIGFASMALGMLLLMLAVYLSNSSLHTPLVFVGFIVFNSVLGLVVTLIFGHEDTED